jgi:DNA-binding NarL/FixJ family response regulator
MSHGKPEDPITLAVTARTDWFAHGVAVFLENALTNAIVIPASRCADMADLIDRGWPDMIAVALPTRRQADMAHLDTVHARWPQAELLVLSSDYFEDTAERARAVGARAYVTTGCDPDSVARAVHAARAGEHFFPCDGHRSGPTDAGVSPRHMPDDLDERVAKLTRREREVMEMLGRGYANREIAAALNLREGTVRIYVHRVIRQLGLRNRVDVALCAQSLGRGGRPSPP